MSRTIRGIRDTIPGGYVIGRLPNAGDGAPQLVSMRELAVATASVPATVTPVTSGGTGITSGTSGGVLGFTAATTIASSGLLGSNQLVLGGGAGATPSTPVGLGTTTTLLHGNAAGAPTWGSVSLTADVSGTLPEARGGTNQSTYTLGDTLYASAANTLAKLAGNTAATRKFLRQTGTGVVSAAPTWDTILAADVPGSALTKTDDTNVTLTLGGSTTTALLNAASLTLGWTGQLGLTRGGTAASLTASNGGIVYSGAAALAILAGTATAGQMLRSGASAAPAWSTATYPASAGTSANVLRSDGTNFLSAALAAADLSNGTTGSGAVMLTASPSTTGTLTAAAITMSNQLTVAYSGGLAVIKDTQAYSSGVNGGAAYFQGLDSGAINTSLGIIQGLSNGSDQGYMVFKPRNGGANTTTLQLGSGTAGSVYVPLIGTTASAANCFIDNTTTPVNSILRVTSRAEFKTDVENLDPDIVRNLVAKFRAVWFRSLCDADRKDWSFYGGISEELAAIDPRLVFWTRSIVGYEDESYDEHVLEDAEVQSVEVRDGKAVLVKRIEKRPAVDLLPLVDEAGDPVMAEVEPGVMQQVIHQTPRMIQQTRKKPIYGDLIPDGIQYDRLAVFALAAVQMMKGGTL